MVDFKGFVKFYNIESFRWDGNWAHFVAHEESADGPRFHYMIRDNDLCRFNVSSTDVLNKKPNPSVFIGNDFYFYDFEVWDFYQYDELSFISNHTKCSFYRNYKSDNFVVKDFTKKLKKKRRKKC